MRENIEKSIKRWLKRKVTITLGMMVAFMITGGIVYSNDGVINESVNIKVVNGKIVVEIGGVQTEIGNTWTNNGKIDVAGGNGIIIDSSVTEDSKFSLINNGSIIGNNSFGYEKGNGIYNYNGIIKNLINNGVILGNSDKDAQSSGNGILNLNGKIENLTNRGVILGSGNGDNLNNANGIYILGGEQSFLNILNNTGTILGKSNSLSSNGNNGIYNYNGIIKNLTNSGLITGNSSSGNWCTGNGIINLDAKIETLLNNGLITGNINNSTDYNSNEIYYSSNGILNYGNLITILTNNGIILGKSNTQDLNGGNGIYNYFGTITTLINYGIIAGNNKAIYNSSGTINQTNYGLLIDEAGTDNQTINAGAGGEQTIDGVNKFIINGVDENATASAIKSSELERKITTNKNNYYDEEFKIFSNLIVNVVGDTDTSLNLDTSLSTLSSTINGYKDAIVFTEKGKTFYGQNVIINGGENAFVGSEGNDTIELKKLIDGQPAKSIVNGNITLGKGNDILSAKDGTTINGNIDMGDGTDTIKISSSTLNGDITANGDTITMDTSSINGNSNLTNSTMTLTSTTLNGDITANEGKISISGTGNRLFNVGATTINGDITLTNGEIYVKDGSIINGDITLKGEKATVWLDKNQAINGNIAIDSSVTEKILGVNYNVNSDADMTSLKNQTDKFTGFDVKLKDGGNTVTLTDLNINSITGGSGVDNFKTTIEKLVKIDGGEDNDVLEITSGTFDNTKDNSITITNIEELKLANENNNVDVGKLSGIKKIFGGRGDDTFNNVGSNTLFFINGGEGNDTINMIESLDNIQADTIFTTNGIEKLNLTGDNTLSLNDLTYTKNINFGTGNNSLTLGTENSGTEFDFTQENLINGNVGINLNGNTGMLNSTFANNTVTLNNNFANGNITFTNGIIKFGIGNTTFENGVNSSYTLDTNYLIGEGITLETYAFLNISNDKLTVKSWNDLINGLGNDYIGYENNYNNSLKEYNQEGKDGVTNAFNTWNKNEIADYIVDGSEFENVTLDNNATAYDKYVVNNTLTINTSKGGDINNLIFNTLSAKNLVVVGDGSSGNNIVNFNRTTTINNVDATKFNNLTLDFNTDEGNGVNLGNIAFGAVGNKLNIDNSSNVNSIGKISGKVDITIDTIGENSDGFDKVLAGANAGLNESEDNNSITVTNQANGLELNTEYRGTLIFNGVDNNITLSNTIGNLVMGSGNDSVTLDISTFTGNIAVNVDGKDGDDIFNIGSPVSTLENSINQKLDGKTLTGTINSFEDINVNESVNLASDLDITGANKITIGAGKELGLNVDYTKTEDGKVIGHALYDKGIEVNNNSGKIVVGTSTANEDTVISMGNGDTASTITNGENIFMSNSVNHTATYDRDNNVINITIKDHIIGENEAVKYAHLDRIYQSIVDASKIGLMAPSSTLTDKTEDEAIKAQLEFYGKIYNSTPYAYSNDISRETANMVNDSIMDSRFKADEGRWLHYGAIAGQGYDDDNSYYGRGYYNSVDLGVAEVDIESDIYSAYYMGEYGKTDKLALGYVIAGNNSNTDIGESDLKGSGYYLGAYAKYNTGNLRLIAGLGYQHNYYEADRRVSNDYQSMSVEKKYTDDTLTAYSGVRYIHNLTDDLTVEPYARVSLTQVMQHSINEADNGDLSISVDGKDFTTVDSEIGVDLVKSTTVKDGKVNLIAGVGAEIILDGYERENLTAKINGSSKTFDIVSEEEENFRGKVSLGVEYEKTNGVFYNAKGSYIRTEDNNNYNFEVGIGYRF